MWEWSWSLMVTYPWQYIKKCCLCTMQFPLHTKHVLSSIGVDAPLFSYFPVCIRIAWHPNLSLVRLIMSEWVSEWISQSVSSVISRVNYPLQDTKNGTDTTNVCVSHTCETIDARVIKVTILKQFFSESCLTRPTSILAVLRLMSKFHLLCSRC